MTLQSPLVDGKKFRNSLTHKIFILFMFSITAGPSTSSPSVNGPAWVRILSRSRL